MSGPFGYPDGCGDVAQADSRITRHADKNVGVVREEIPTGLGLLTHISRYILHELLIRCLHDRTKDQPDSLGVSNAGGVTHTGRLTDPAVLTGPGGRSPNGGNDMSTAKEPIDGYDGLKPKDVVASLSDRSQVELARIASYEQANEGRKEIFDKLRWLQQDEPLPGYDALSSEGVLAALGKAGPEDLKRVRGYERKFGARREILKEIDQLHRARRVPLVSRDSAA